MTAALRTGRLDALVLALLGIPVFLWGLGSYSVVNGDEGLYHTVALLMVESGDWTRLEFFGQHRVYDTFMNSPTHYWARAGLITLFGDSLWTMRVLTATFGLLNVLLVRRLVLAILGEDGRAAGFVAGLVLMTSFQFVWLHGARTGELDMFVCFLVTAAALTFLRAVRGESGFWLHHVCLALLLTTKLPAAIAPVLGELLFFAVTPGARGRFLRYTATGFAIVPLGLLWHVYQALSMGEFGETIGKMFEEAAGKHGKGERVGTPLENLVWYANLVLFGAFPWSLVMIVGLVRVLARALWRSSGGGESVATDDEALGWRASLCILAGVVVFFAFVSKRFPWYILPAYPFLAAAAGAFLAALVRRAPGVVAIAVSAALVTLGGWLSVPLDLNPFEERAPLVASDVAWREVAAMGTPVAALITFALATGALFLLRGAGQRSGA